MEPTWDRWRADEQATSPRSDDWCARAFEHSLLDQLGMTFGLDKAGADYSIPLDPSGVTTTRRAFLRPGQSGAFRVKVGQKVPIGRVKPSAGRDGHLVVIDAHGHEWDYWMLSTPADSPPQRPQLAAYGYGPNYQVRPPFNPSYDVVAATVVEVCDPDGQPVDVATYPGNGGSGQKDQTEFICAPLSRGVATAAEAATGSIDHVLRVSIGNAMPGPAAPDDVADMDDPGIGTRWGAAGLPCGLHEGVGATGDLAGTVPHGLGIVVEKTDRQIDAYLDARRYTGGRRELARLFAVALRTHGMRFLISTTPGNTPTVQTNGADAKAWKAAGISSGNGRDLLAGYIDGPGCLRALAWPTAELADGTITSRAHHTARIVPAAA